MKNDLGIKLLFIPAILLSLLVGFVYINDNKKVVVPNFINKDVNEVIKWCAELNSDYACIFKYENSRDFDVNKVISQSVKEKEKLKDKITFTISNELLSNISLPDISKYTKNDILLWAKSNNINEINFVEEESETINLNHVIRVEPTENIYPDTTLTVYVSKTNLNTEIEIKGGDYINLSESSFIQKIKELSLVPNHSLERDDYSDYVAKDNIVWHGSGSYTKGETVNYGLSKGINLDGIVVKEDAYLDYSEERIITKAQDLGLKPFHNTERDDYSNSIEKGNVVWHGSGNYEKGETFNYGLSLGAKEGDDDSGDNTIYINQDKYVGKLEQEVIDATKKLGLNPTHLENRDAYSSTIPKGAIVTHGFGEYVKDEAFNYGLSLGKENEEPKQDEKPSQDSIKIKENQFVGKSEQEVIDATKKLNLKPTHLSDRDAYSDTIEKGKIVSHGYGDYEKDEAFNYGLSLGKRKEGDSINITQDQFNNLTVDDFDKKVKELKLVPSYDKTLNDYSDTVSEGNILWHGYGKFEANEKIRYGVSLGKKPEEEKKPDKTEMATLNDYTDIRNGTIADNVDKAKENATAYLNNAGFNNYSFETATSKDYGKGILLKITVDGNQHTSRKQYSKDAKIVFVICSGQE